MKEHIYYVYILLSHSRTLYIGVTNDLERRVREHKEKTIRGFTARYNINQLVHFEEFADIHAAIAKEKELKGWSRVRKIALIERNNPLWADLSDRWYSPVPSRSQAI